MRRYIWHSVVSLGWPFPTVKYKYIFQIKYTKTILSNRTRKLLRFEITKMLVAISGKNIIVSFIIIFGTLLSPIVGLSLYIACDDQPIKILTLNDLRKTLNV